MTMRTISSPSNELVKQTARLLVDGQYRRQMGLAVLEGFKLVQDAIEAGAQVRWLMLSEDSVQVGSAGALISSLDPDRVFVVTGSVMRKVSSTVTPQGVVAVVTAPRPALTSAESGSVSRVVALDGVQDPGNCGTLIRSAAAFDFSVAVLPGTVDPYSAKVLRASMGGLYRTSVYWCSRASDLFEFARKRGLAVWIAHNQSGIPADEAEIDDNVILVLGSEGHGHVSVSPEMQLNANRVWIPMQKRMESLNVAMAGTILMYESYRRRQAWRC